MEPVTLSITRPAHVGVLLGGAECIDARKQLFLGFGAEQFGFLHSRLQARLNGAVRSMWAVIWSSRVSVLALSIYHLRNESPHNAHVDRAARASGRMSAERLCGPAPIRRTCHGIQAHDRADSEGHSTDGPRGVW